MLWSSECQTVFVQCFMVSCHCGLRTQQWSAVSDTAAEETDPHGFTLAEAPAAGRSAFLWKVNLIDPYQKIQSGSGRMKISPSL